MERLQKIIARAGIASRRAAEQLIQDGVVTVNGQVITTLGTQVEESDVVTVNGEVLTQESHVYYLLNKPAGCLSTTSDDLSRKTVIDLFHVPERIFPIGRLDYDSTGVLLLTNDGEFMNALIHPKYHVEKEYHVKVAGLLRKEDSAKLRKGVKLDDEVTQPAHVFDVRYDEKKENTYAKITVTEGKYHQIKRMFEDIGHPVLKLRRHRFGTITCDELAPGEYRRLKPHEVKQLWNLSRFGKTQN